MKKKKEVIRLIKDLLKNNSFEIVFPTIFLLQQEYDITDKELDDIKAIIGL